MRVAGLKKETIDSELDEQRAALEARILMEQAEVYASLTDPLGGDFSGRFKY
jgi:hypothetical protein